MFDDGDLEERLRRAADRFDPVPDRLRYVADEAYAIRTLGAELAELVFDSLVESDAPLVRGDDQPRLLTFQAGAFSVDVELAGPHQARRIIGQVIPAEQMQIDVRCGAKARTVQADELGRFIAEDLPGGPLSLRCRPSDANRPPVVTEWITVD
jgi:hypothetical protein